MSCEAASDLLADLLMVRVDGQVAVLGEPQCRLGIRIVEPADTARGADGGVGGSDCDPFRGVEQCQTAR